MDTQRQYYLLRAGLAPAVVTLLSGCADLGYYLQSAQGHLAMMRAARPVEELLGDTQGPLALKSQLELAQRMRRFAVIELGLPDNPSYTRYADLKRSAVVWNVVATAELSLKLKTWCFPVTGCVGYRGYFDELQARELAAELKSQGLEVSVYGVPAYSTLGWMNWAGGDPLLNTFIHYPEGELARLIFHELAHQVAFARDDTMFNESFATAVERLGSARWLARQAKPQAVAEYERGAQRRAQFRALTSTTRQALTHIYEDNWPVVLKNEEKFALKREAMANFRVSYQKLRAGWMAASATPGAGTLGPRAVSGYDQWVANANNASFGAQAAYDELVPQFEALYRQAARASPTPWQPFYDAVRRLAELPTQERRQKLAALAAVAPDDMPN